MYQSIPKPPIPPPRATPGHLTRVKLRMMGNLTQNQARPVGHLTFESKRLSAVGNKRISQFFDSAREPRSCRFHVGFSVVVVLYSYIVENTFVAWSEVKLNKKFVVVEKFVWASFADILKCLRYQEIREMINRRTFKYVELILFTVLLELLRAF